MKIVGRSYLLITSGSWRFKYGRNNLGIFLSDHSICVSVILTGKVNILWGSSFLNMAFLVEVKSLAVHVLIFQIEVSLAVLANFFFHKILTHFISPSTYLFYSYGHIVIWDGFILGGLWQGSHKYVPKKRNFLSGAYIVIKRNDT